MHNNTLPGIIEPEPFEPKAFENGPDAVAYLKEIYQHNVNFLCKEFTNCLSGSLPKKRFRACYPRVQIETTSYTNIDSRLSFGIVAAPGSYSTTITRPDLFENYLKQQLSLLIKNHGVPITVSQSDTPIPIHFAMDGSSTAAVPNDASMQFTLRDYFDVPDLDTTNDDIVNSESFTYNDGSKPLAPFTAQRVDYSLARLQHYTATSPEHFQNHILFTNYQFYVDEFEAYARRMLADKSSDYTSFVSTNNVEITDPDTKIDAPTRLPQMPSFHLKRENGNGITLVNIGVGPSNAKPQQTISLSCAHTRG